MLSTGRGMSSICSSPLQATSSVAAVDRRAEGLAAPPEGGGTSVGTYGGDRRYFRVGGYHSAVAADDLMRTDFFRGCQAHLDFSRLRSLQSSKLSTSIR